MSRTSPGSDPRGGAAGPSATFASLVRTVRALLVRLDGVFEEPADGLVLCSSLLAALVGSIARFGGAAPAVLPPLILLGCVLLVLWFRSLALVLVRSRERDREANERREGARAGSFTPRPRPPRRARRPGAPHRRAR